MTAFLAKYRLAPTFVLAYHLAAVVAGTAALLLVPVYGMTGDGLDALAFVVAAVVCLVAGE